MELTLLQALLNDPSKLIPKIEATRDKDDGGADDYQPENHDVTDSTVRKDREVLVPVMDDDGQPVILESGEPKMRTEREPVARITSSAQKQIVNWAVQIAAGVPVELVPPVDMKPGSVEEKMFNMLKKTLRDNKMEYVDQEILRLTCIYKICAEIWYSEECPPEYWGELGKPTSKFKMRLMILSEATGDTLYPIRNSIGKMIALGRAYTVRDDNDKEVKKFDLFTDDAIRTWTQTSGSEWDMDLTKLPYGKANFIVHEQPRREWQDVTSKINRLEVLDSNHADQNDATGSPMIAAIGKVEGFGKRGDTGKVFELENGGDLKIVESKGAPESLKMERENLVKGIFDETNTPQISFSEAQGFGANVPGITIKLLFLPATLKAMSRQSGGWGMSIQRRYNFLKSAMSIINIDVEKAVDLEVSPRFSIYMPENTVEKYQNITKLVSAGLISKLTAIRMLGIVDDPEAEWEAIQEEADELAKREAAKAPQPAP